MFVYTVTKKRAIRYGLIILAVIVGIIIGITAILTAINSGAEERKVPIYSVERQDNKIALTFDCAWGNSNTDELLAVLAKENIRATFFVTGEFCDKYPEDVLKIFKAGHEIQNHSDRHPHIDGININDLILDTKECSRKIRMITGTAPTLYRAPYGEYDNTALFTIEGMGYKYVQWDVDSIDWQDPDAKTIVNRVVKGTKSGSILLFHNDLANTTEALPEVISKLKEKGFEFVPVSELIYHNNYRIDNAGRQIFEGSGNSSAFIHTGGNATVASAMELMLYNLTLDEIKSLEDGLNPQVAMKLSGILTDEQINAITSLSDDELKAAWGALMEAKLTQGTADDLQLIDQENEEGGIGITPIFDELDKTVIEGFISEQNENNEFDLEKIAEVAAAAGYELPIAVDEFAKP
ncbi:MAG: polysaccharide deacetylase family protein [Oscillospiraceae bacterium]|nr:polysaccharide deacetylase family protein [Oscillospiraceae bacterium]